MSVWNIDKYHWEEHNYNEWAKKRLNELIKDINIEGWEIKDTNFSSIVTSDYVRKGHEIRTFEIVFDFKFKHGDMEGKISFPDISNDAADSPDDWEYLLEFTGKSNDRTPSEKKALRNDAEKDVAPVFRQIFANWYEEFKKISD